ncbi:hypothetical protein [Robinsoniella peoriensis]
MAGMNFQPCSSTLTKLYSISY